jgi:hypothetical protein
MIKKLRSALTERQKHHIKYLLAATSLKHIQTFFPVFLPRNSNKLAKEIFASMHPYTLICDLKRVGGNGDGGYLIPNNTHIYDGLISPGVGDSIRFESEFVGKSFTAVLIDATVAKPDNLPENLLFLPRMLGGKKSADGLFVTLQDIRNEYFPNSKSLALQMDIEGGEYSVFESLSRDSLEGIDLILVEFHNLHIMINIERNVNPLLRSIMLLSEDFALVHSHPNNAGGFFLNRYKVLPKVVETTWVRRNLVVSSETRAELPNKLDVPNDTQIWDLKYPTFK